MALQQRIPVTILTGFLGSGKTTLLNHLLPQPRLADAVVIINEFGEIGLDHLLVERTDDQLTLLKSGCLCCTVRGDLVSALADLPRRRLAGEIGECRHIVIETTGLADPVPILHTFMADPAINPHYQVENVITTVDAATALASLARYPEAMRQVAVADRILLTKCDLVTEAELARVRENIAAINPGCGLIEAAHGVVDADLVFDGLARDESASRWQTQLTDSAQHSHHEQDHDHLHDHGIVAHCFVLERPVRWEDFSFWLECLAAMRGDELLRLKGIVAAEDDPDRPLVVHGVQHLFHPPVRLERWPSEDRTSRLVVIARDLPRSLIADTMRKFGKAA